MGLAEKRAAADYQQKKFPDVKKKIDDAAGFPVEMEVRWDTLPAKDRGEHAADWFDKVYFTPLSDAFAKIAADDMGKQALKGALKKVIVDGSSGSSSNSFSFKDGILTILHQSDANVDEVDVRAKEIKQLIEEKL